MHHRKQQSFVSLYVRSTKFRPCYTAKHHSINATQQKENLGPLSLCAGGWCVASVCFACDCSKSYRRDVIKSRALLCTPSQKTRDDDDATRHRSTTSLKNNIHKLDVCQKRSLLDLATITFCLCHLWLIDLRHPHLTASSLHCVHLYYSVCVVLFLWKLCVNIASFLQLVRYLGWFYQNILLHCSLWSWNLKINYKRIAFALHTEETRKGYPWRSFNIVTNRKT